MEKNVNNFAKKTAFLNHFVLLALKDSINLLSLFIFFFSLWFLYEFDLIDNNSAYLKDYIFFFIVFSFLYLLNRLIVNFRESLKSIKFSYSELTNIVGEVIVNIVAGGIYFIVAVFISNTFLNFVGMQGQDEISSSQKVLNNRNSFLVLSFFVISNILMTKKFVNLKKSAFFIATIFVFYSISTFHQLVNSNDTVVVSDNSEIINERLSCNKNSTLDNAKSCTFLITTDIMHGSAFSVKEGYLVTNRHVIEDSREIYTYYDERKYKLSIWNYSNDVDVAILKMPDELKVATCDWFDSDSLNIAEDLYVFGWPIEPLGESTVTKGIYSRTIVDENNSSFIQTDASLNAGNSGGPLINECGVAGLVTSKMYWVDTALPAEGNGYALSSKFVKPIVEKLLSTGQGNMKAPLSSRSYFERSYTLAEEYYLDIDVIKRYVGELYDVRRSWEGVTGIDQVKLNKLMDLFNRQIDFSNHLISKLSDGRSPSDDDFIMWESVVSMSEESSNLTQELLKSMGY